MTVPPYAEPDPTPWPSTASAGQMPASAQHGAAPAGQEAPPPLQEAAEDPGTTAPDAAPAPAAPSPPSAAPGPQDVSDHAPHAPAHADGHGQRPQPGGDTGPGAGEGSTWPPSAPGVQQNVGGDNHGTMIGIQNVNEIRRLRGTPLPKDWIEDRLAAYLADETLTNALNGILTAHRVAVLHGPPGTGRYSTALHTLTRQPTVTAVRQVRREPNDPVDLEGLIDEDTGWILDLRDEEEILRPGFGLHLTADVTDHLRATRSFVIVVTHPDIWARVAGEATELARPITPPTGLNVLRAHLTRPLPVLGGPEQWLADDKIIAAMKDARPATAADWARIIRAAADLNSASTEPKPISELVDSVVQSANNWRNALRSWHTQHTVSAHRNYLLAAAVLDGAPAETVYDAHITLGAALQDTSPPAGGQQGPGIIELTHTIGGELADDDHIRFHHPGYAEAVVDYFWVDRPHHVAAFTHWTAELATTLPPDLGKPLAERVTQWATRYTLAKQSFTVLRTIATDWAKTPHLHGPAQELLVAAAVGPTDGKRAREQYLTWAKAPDTDDPSKRGHTPTALKRALAGALAQLAPAYPQIALKRLAELAVHTTDDAVADAVGDALTQLWDHTALQDSVRTILSSWFTSSQPHYVAAARRAFLHLAARTAPDDLPLLLKDTVTRSWTLAGWRCALDGPVTTPAERRQHLARRRLGPAGTQAHRPDRLHRRCFPLRRRPHLPRAALPTPEPGGLRLAARRHRTPAQRTLPPARCPRMGPDHSRSRGPAP